MTEPFRDEMGAALARADKLAEENDELRDELQRLRETAHSVHAESPDHALAKQTLAVLDRIEAATRVEAVPIQKSAPERAELRMPPRPKPAAGPVMKPARSGVSVIAFIVACLVCLAIGIMLGAMTR